MSIHSSDFMVVICSQLSACPALEKLSNKNSLNLFNIFTPNYIVAIDNEITANHYILSEAMNLLEICSQLGTFYGYDFVGEVQKTITDSRSIWNAESYGVSEQVSQKACTQQELMGDYFINSAKDMAYFLQSNPVYLGVYIYVYLSSVSMS